MSEFRQNPITKQWVLMAPNRAKRPEDFKTYSVMHGLPEVENSCVFCPGSETLNPELYRVPNNDKWEIRVIPNKFATLDYTKAPAHKDFFISRSGYGEHEVLITRKHNEPVALQSITTVELTLMTFIERIESLSQNPNIAYVQIFHNHGRDAGASLVHPHYQLIATPFFPPQLHKELLGCYHYYQDNKSCVYCDIITEEIKIKDRLVYESEHFVVISAYASRSPFEMWVLPKKHSARFEDIDVNDEIKHLAFVLKITLGQLYTKLSDPPLNFYIHTMPLKKDKHTLNEEKAYHWHLTIFPRITIWAGFEYATGIPVNPVTPEVGADFLRGNIV